MNATLTERILLYLEHHPIVSRLRQRLSAEPQRYTIERRVPEHYTTFRWCVCRDGNILAHRDNYSDAMTLIEALRAQRPVILMPVKFKRSRWRLALNGVMQAIDRSPVIKPEPDAIRLHLYGK